MLKVEVAGRGSDQRGRCVCWTLYLAVVFLGAYFYHSTNGKHMRNELSATPLEAKFNLPHFVLARQQYASARGETPRGGLLKSRVVTPNLLIRMKDGLTQ